MGSGAEIVPSVLLLSNGARSPDCAVAIQTASACTRRSHDNQDIVRTVVQSQPPRWFHDTHGRKTQERTAPEEESHCPHPMARSSYLSGTTCRSSVCVFSCTLGDKTRATSNGQCLSIERYYLRIKVAVRAVSHRALSSPHMGHFMSEAWIRRIVAAAHVCTLVCARAAFRTAWRGQSLHTMPSEIPPPRAPSAHFCDTRGACFSPVI